MNEAQLEEDRQRSKERTKCKIAITALKGPLEMLKRFAASTVEADKRLQEQTCKVSRWLNACEKLVKKKLSRDGQAEYWEAAARIDKFLPEEGMPTEPMIRRIVELFMAGLFLEWGVWATCKRYSTAQEWVYLDMTATTLGNMLMDLFPGVDLGGTAIYMHIHGYKWDITEASEPQKLRAVA